jgi:flagellar protein FliO/FliZ
MSVVVYLRFAAALAIVLALIGALAWAARRFGLSPRATGTGREKRLQIMEVVSVDARRRLVLVRRDQVEHLLLLGHAQDVVVERNISRAPVSAGEAVKP